MSYATRKVDALVRFDRNSRTHSEAQVAQLAASIKEFGFTSPILIDETNTIIAGEGRWTAAKMLKLDEVPCIVLTGLTAHQKAAYVIADNKLALNSGWDEATLHAELARLSDLNFDINLTGFNDVEALDLSFAVVGELGEVVTNKDWSGMPEFNQPDDKPFRSLIIHFEDQANVDKFAKATGMSVTEKTKFLWFPDPVRRAANGEVYE